MVEDVPDEMIEPLIESGEIESVDEILEMHKEGIRTNLETLYDSDHEGDTLEIFIDSSYEE